MKNTYLSLDIGGSHITSGIIEVNGKSINIAACKEHPLNSNDSGSIIIDQILNIIDGALKSTNDLKGIGIAIPGPFDYNRGIAAISGVNKFESLFSINIREEIKKAYSGNIYFLNDASAFALGEYYAGAANGSERTIVTTIGTGLGSTFLVNGNIITEEVDGVPKDGYLYNIPFKEGIADDYFSTRWFVSKWNIKNDYKIRDVKELFELASNGDENALAIFDEFAENYIDFFTPIIKNFNPDNLVVGGNIAKASALFLDKIKFGISNKNINTCQLWNKAPLIGAAMYVEYKNNSMNNKNTGRCTQQYLAPSKTKPTSIGQYDIYPGFPIGNNKIKIGVSEIADWIEKQETVVIDGYIGVFWDDFICKVAEELKKRGKDARWFHSDTALKPSEEIEEMLIPYLGELDPLFGKITDKSLIDWFDESKFKLIKPDASSNINILIGTGASLVGWNAPLIYIDLPKNELQFRMRAGVVNNFGLKLPKDNQQSYKHFYFVDWIVLNKHKASFLSKIDLLIDGQRPDELLSISGDNLRKGLEKMSLNFFRARPWFEPGAWGGTWMKEHIDGLNKDVENLAWSFELMVLENGLMLESDGYKLEISFDFLMYNNYQNILGDCAERFKYDFPIRFDLLDTFDGGNLSIQCHPHPEYIKQKFGMPFTQDETYYILDKKGDTDVYLGFQENIDPAEFHETLVDSQIRSKKIDIEKYVQKISAEKHGLYLIPNGTIHASGSNNLVLEISSAPYIFTFKMYDWLRLGLDGKPRPLNIEHGMNNLYFDRKGKYVQESLISKPCIIEENEDYVVEHLPTHHEHFYDIYRYQITNEVNIETKNKCHVMMLVEGQSIILKTEDGMTQRFNYAETFIVPAAAQSYTIINETPAHKIMLIKAFAK